MISVSGVERSSGRSSSSASPPMQYSYPIVYEYSVCSVCV
jgi:hypothetical protein